MLNIFVALAAITQGLVGLFVYLKKRNSITNISFGLLSLSTLVWALTNYFYTLNPTGESALGLIRLVLFFVVIQNTVFYVFAKNYPENDQVISSRKFAALIVFSIVVCSATLSPYVFTSVTISNNQSNPNPGVLIPIFIAHALFTIAGGLNSLFRKAKTKNKNQKRQLQFIIAASILNWVLVPLTNFVITLGFKTTFFARVSPIYTLLFASIIGYAIVTQKLFDIRAAVARTVAYVLSLGFIGLAYGSVIYAGFALLNFNSLSRGNERAIFVGLALITATAFPVTKRYFDRLTKKLFYQDAYDPQEFLDNLNKILVSNVDLEPLLKDVSDLIEENIKADYCVFTLRESAYYPVRTIGTKSKQFNKEDADDLHNLTPKIHHRVLITDELDETQNDLKEIMNKYDVSVLARLVSTVKLDVEGIGYLVLGPKKSGNIYTKQDEDIIRIIANELVIAIENALKFEEIQKFNETLQEKIETATRQLRTTNEKLKLLDETKDEFISMASHQLRTPLTSVKGYLSMVLEGDAGNVSQMQRKLLDQAFVSSQRMVYLIADLLNVSRLRTGKFVIEPVATNLAEVVNGEASQLQDTAKSRGLTLTYNKPEKFPMLMLDETKIRQVIMNFMDNAIYYTPSGGNIDIELKETDKTVEYTVRDDGIGVPKHEQHHLFSKFYRAGNAKKARPDGTGLGLFMAKKVIVAQGGSLIFSSVEGKGSTFGFAFEKAKLQVSSDKDQGTK